MLCSRWHEAALGIYETLRVDITSCSEAFLQANLAFPNTPSSTNDKPSKQQLIFDALSSIPWDILIWEFFKSGVTFSFNTKTKYEATLTRTCWQGPRQSQRPRRPWRPTTTAVTMTTYQGRLPIIPLPSLSPTSPTESATRESIVAMNGKDMSIISFRSMYICTYIYIYKYINSIQMISPPIAFDYFCSL